MAQQPHALLASPQVLHAALEVQPSWVALWEAAIFFEERSDEGDRAHRVLELYKQAAGSSLPEEERSAMSGRAVEFASVYGSAQQALQAYRHHATHHQVPGGAAAETSRKRGAGEGGEAAAGGHPAAKQARYDQAAAAPAVAPTYSAAPAAYHTGYAPAAASAAPYGAYPHAAPYYPQYPGYGYPYGY